MSPAILTLTCALVVAGDATPARKPHPFAPSLPQLTEDEEAALDKIIDRFILQDTGQLAGEEGKKARQDFDQLGPEATFALIRGLNRAAKIDHSCPALVIAKKLAKILNASADSELLEFARDNIGLGVKQTRHRAVLDDLRLAVTLRKNQLGQKGGATVTPTTKPAAKMSVAELADAVSSEKGTRLRLALMELAYRPGEEALDVLANAAATLYDADMRQVARDFLEKNLTKQADAVLKEKLKDRKAEVRAAAARAVGAKGLRYGGELIDLLDDEYEQVRAAARQSLVRLGGGKTDFGPDDKASEAERAAAVKRWREWWAKQK